MSNSSIFLLRDTEKFTDKSVSNSFDDLHYNYTKKYVKISI
ncbi:hypothetical protein AM2_1228 [Lactococcus cremoris]|uniref:Uncharacterized protein n=1 Tax=Lactococcus lactis subsp. cremoris TaxID=1359 RepID=A0A166YY46_LACLC|nr:hypothetical protein llh_2265 [Lactococcus cremoris subsp. cremoris A76]KZK06216.1 hypothetical protein AB996_1422 [Lactococcus cremoris]KZK06806.1 hypothetical protein V4_2052 [Lactococcus cremoris]KZK08535.1 hypothetical protein AB995_2100 [Lactococcus cremoris]KZK39766.1 hypothetical protein N41_0913 [Lactococcus cremoris]